MQPNSRKHLGGFRNSQTFLGVTTLINIVKTGFFSCDHSGNNLKIICFLSTFLRLSFFVEAVDLPENEEERKSAVAVVELQVHIKTGVQRTPVTEKETVVELQVVVTVV